jgi:hypothetical protein
VVQATQSHDSQHQQRRAMGCPQGQACRTTTNTLSYITLINHNPVVYHNINANAVLELQSQQLLIHSPHAMTYGISRLFHLTVMMQPAIMASLLPHMALRCMGATRSYEHAAPAAVMRLQARLCRSQSAL